jgi:serine/threonine protein kinase
MLVGYSPFYGEDEDKLYDSIKSDQVNFPEDMSSAAASFLSQLLEREPAKRLGMKTSPFGDIRQHAFFSQIDWLKVESFQLEPPFKPNVV